MWPFRYRLTEVSMVTDFGIFICLLLVASSDLSSASDSFYWMIMALSQILLLNYLNMVSKY